MFNVSNIPSDFLSTKYAINLIHSTTERIERRLSEEQCTNESYSAFMDLINPEMSVKLRCVSFISVSSKNEKMRCKKYWNDELQLQWNKVCEKEKLWLKCKNSNLKKKCA